MSKHPPCVQDSAAVEQQNESRCSTRGGTYLENHLEEGVEFFM